MSKGKRNNRFGKTKTKAKPTYEILRDILSGAVTSTNYQDIVRQRFIDFVFAYKGDNLPKIYKVLLNNKDFADFLPVVYFDFKKPYKELMFRDIEVNRLFDLLLVPLKNNHQKLIDFDEQTKKFEIYLFNGDYKKADSILTYINSSYGDSIWLVRAKLLLFFEQGKHNNVAELIYHHKQNSSSDLHKIIHTFVSIFESSDPQLLLKNTIIRDNNELLDGEVLSLAAINTLLYLPYPSSYDIDPLYSLVGLQALNLFDLYLYLKEVALQCEIEDCVNVVNKIKFEYYHQISAVLTLVSPSWNLNKTNHNKHLELYQAGDYLGIINDLESNYLHLDNIIINLNIYAKSYVYGNRDPLDSLPSMLFVCLTNLINIYNLRDIKQSISVITSIKINTNCFDISKHIQIAIEKALTYESTPLNRLKTSRLSKYTAIPNTKACDFLRNAPLNLFSFNTVSERDRSKTAYILNPSDQNYSIYLDTCPLDKDAIELKAATYLHHENLGDLLNFVVETLIENEESYICFPMGVIENYISQNNIENENSVIFYYFFSSLVNRDSIDALNETFDEYILSLGVERPGDIFNSMKPVTDLQHFILSVVSKVSVMDYMGCFKSSTDLMYERIKILSLLKEDTRSDISKLENEYQKILKEILVQEATANLTTSKVFVDKQGILNVNRGKVNTLVSQYFLLQEKAEALPSKEILVDMNNTLVDLYHLLMIEYLNNQEFGLDSNLSGEIRHTFFNNLMTSLPEENNLITELDSEGKYKLNTHWSKEYDIVNVKITDALNNRLSKFSEAFNELLEQTESWMKVSIDDSKPERTFTFRDPNSVFVNLFESLLICQDSEQLLDKMFNSLDSQLEQCLTNMRQKIDHDFANMLDDLFDDLLNDVNRIKQSASLTSLMISIEQTKNLIKEDVKTASEWFHIRNNKVFSSYPLSEIITISERCFKFNSSNKKVNRPPKSTDINIQGPHVPAMIMTLVNCYANAIKNGTPNSVISLDVTESSEEYYKLAVINKISNNKKQELLAGELAKTQEKLRSMNSNSLLSKEGGSGLYKSKYNLRKLSENFDLHVEVLNQTFVTEVSYNGKDLNS
jgi:hypothetical protein